MKINHIIRMITVALLLLGSMACPAKKIADHATHTNTRAVSLPAFDAIENKTAVTLHISQGSRQSIRVKETTGKSLDLSVRGKTLKIESEQYDGNNDKSLEVWITIPYLKSIINDGILDMDADNIKGKELSLKNTGILTLNADKLCIGSMKCTNTGAMTENTVVDCKQYHFDNSGCLKTQLTLKNNYIFNLNNSGLYTGDIKASGTDVSIENAGAMSGDMDLHADVVRFNNSGSGNQNISFHGDEMSIDNSGMVRVDLHVDCRKLKAESSGMSTLYISGTADDATINSKGVNNIDSSKLNRF